MRFFGFDYKRYLLYGDVIYAIVKSYSFVTNGVAHSPLESEPHARSPRRSNLVALVWLSVPV